MKHLLTILLTGLWCLSAAAQSADTTSAVGLQKLEYTFRVNTVIFDVSGNITGGIRTNENNVVGAGAGWGVMPVISDRYERISLYLYHRLNIPLDKKQRFSIISDIMGGGMFIYKAEVYEHPGYGGAGLKAGQWLWYWSWEPGIAVRLRGKSNIFLGPSIGPSIGPTIGFHVGFTI